MQQSQNNENDEEEEDKGDTQRLYSLHLAKILRGDRTKIEMKISWLEFGQKTALLESKTDFKQSGDSLHQPQGVGIIVRMRTTPSPGQVSGSHIRLHVSGLLSPH